MPEKIVNVSLRVPESLHRQLTAWADTEHRSLHGQILRTLELAVRGRQRWRNLGEVFLDIANRRGWLLEQLAEYVNLTPGQLAVLGQLDVPTVAVTEISGSNDGPQPTILSKAMLELAAKLNENVNTTRLFEAVKTEILGLDSRADLAQYLGGDLTMRPDLPS